MQGMFIGLSSIIVLEESKDPKFFFLKHSPPPAPQFAYFYYNAFISSL